MTPAVSGRRGGRMGIGEVLAALRTDFPDVSISKIRFLESAGLVEPERTSSGYRKFSFADLDRLRYILTAQRDRYLPLKVIREHLEVMSRGLEPPSQAGGAPRVPAPRDQPDTAAAPALRITRQELLANARLSEEQLSQLENYGLVTATPKTSFFDADALVVATVVGQLATYGLEPRHLRSLKTAADREVSLIEQVVTPLKRHRGEAARVRADEAIAELSTLATRLHGALLQIGLRSSSLARSGGANCE
ncbi:MAG: transcriptional regulator FtsR [Nocardioidaceae bacterium]